MFDISETEGFRTRAYVSNRRCKESFGPTESIVGASSEREWNGIAAELWPHPAQTQYLRAAPLLRQRPRIAAMPMVDII